MGLDCRFMFVLVCFLKGVNSTDGPYSISIRKSANAAIAGERYSLNCSADCVHTCRFNWSFSGSVVPSSDCSGVLVFNNITRQDSGLYTCTATNNATNGHTNKSTTIEVNYGPDSISIRKSANAAIAGERYSLNCSAYCEPTCRFNWSFSDSVVPSSDYSGVLVFNNITRQDSGVYTCTATNNATNGHTNKSTTIEVNYYQVDLGVIYIGVGSGVGVLLAAFLIVTLIVIIRKKRKVAIKSIEQQSQEQAIALGPCSRTCTAVTGTQKQNVYSTMGADANVEDLTYENLDSEDHAEVTGTQKENVYSTMGANANVEDLTYENFRSDQGDHAEVTGTQKQNVYSTMGADANVEELTYENFRSDQGDHAEVTGTQKQNVYSTMGADANVEELTYENFRSDQGDHAEEYYMNWSYVGAESNEKQTFNDVDCTANGEDTENLYENTC